MTIERQTLTAVSDLIERRMGLHFPAERHDVLVRGLARGGVEMGIADPEAYAARLLASGLDSDERDALAQALTVGETYFFREPATLAALQERVLPELIEARGKSGEKRIRLWSAGCCSGEEAYTLAIILARMIPNLSEWDITILATDIDPDFLRKARAGRYREWSFRCAPAWLKTGWFSPCARDEYELTARVKQMVSFSYLNLVDDVYPSLVSNTTAMDVILCRNVMMYFAPDRARLVAGRFHRALVGGGWLVMSPSEGCNVSSELFTRVSFDAATLYRKGRSVPVHYARPAPPVRSPVSGACLPVAREKKVVKAVVVPPDAPPTRLEPPNIRPAPVAGAPTETPLAAATAAYAQADYEAVLSLVAALPEPPVSALVLAARACADLGRLDEALIWCKTALERDKLQASVYHLQATVLVAKCDAPAALESLKRVLYLEPYSVLAHFATANLLLQAGETARATKSFRRTMNLLNTLDDAAVVADSDGMTAARLKVIVKHVQASLGTGPRQAARREA